MKILNIKLIALLIALIGMVSSCDMFRDSNGYSIDESDKDLNGSWRIGQVTRNGLDITNTMDFSAFMITFNKDRTYRIDNYLPFIVKKNGTWNIDDPQYPTQLIFKEEGVSETNISSFGYTIWKGERQITLSFAPGCHSNVYTYVLERMPN